MLRILAFLFLLLPAALSAQEHFGKTKAALQKELEQLAATPGSNQRLQITDSSLVVSSLEKKNGLKWTYRFDKSSGLCNYQKVQAGCDSCIQRELNRLISQPALGWKKINENQYVSNFESQLLIELPVDEKENSFILFRANWTKELYDILMKN